MNLPPEFSSTIQNTFREEGYAFLEALPSSIAEASKKWRLTDVQPAPTLSYNFVAFAQQSPYPTGRGVRGEGKDVVLKMGVPNREFLSEMAALRLFNGEGACRLIDSDEEKYWMLLERLVPGEMLAEMKDDEQATRIAGEVMKRIWRPVYLCRPGRRTGSRSGRIHPAHRLVRGPGEAAPKIRQWDGAARRKAGPAR